MIADLAGNKIINTSIIIPLKPYEYITAGIYTRIYIYIDEKEVCISLFDLQSLILSLINLGSRRYRLKLTDSDYYNITNRFTNVLGVVSIFYILI